jgi:hypothetical protein
MRGQDGTGTDRFPYDKKWTNKQKLDQITLASIRGAEGDAYTRCLIRLIAIILSVVLIKIVI